MSDTDTIRQAAKEAAVRSLVANGVYVLMVIGVTVALTRRDWLARQWARARRAGLPTRAQNAEEAAVAQLRRDVSAYEHGAA